MQEHKPFHDAVEKEGGISSDFVCSRDPAKLKVELKEQREAGVAVVSDAVG